MPQEAQQEKPKEKKENPNFPLKTKYFQGTGRRKRAVASVRIYKGKGNLVINQKPYQEYFKVVAHQENVKSPLKIVGLDKKYDLYAYVTGGGPAGQSEAVRHGTARAIEKLNKEHRTSLKKAGYLRRDPRKKERKKYGLKRARKAPQFSKR